MRVSTTGASVSPKLSSIKVVRISAESGFGPAATDLTNGALLYDVWVRFAFHDIRQRFRRSVLGPFWLTLSMGIMVGALGLVFSTLFQQEVGKTLPFIAIGLIFWSLLTSCIIEGTQVFISNDTYIRNVPSPISLHLYRMLARNIFIWAFNMAIYVIVLIWGHIVLGWYALLVVPGFFLFMINVAWISLMAGILSTRYRDIPQVISNLIQVVFFVTPIFWSPEALPRRPAFVVFNPFYHLIELVRAPLLGQFAAPVSWGYCIVMALVGLTATAWLYRRAVARIAYWV